MKCFYISGGGGLTVLPMTSQFKHPAPSTASEIENNQNRKKPS